jgi:hypothetical protein
MNWFLEFPNFPSLQIMTLFPTGKQQASTEDEACKTLYLDSLFQGHGWQNLWVDISLSDRHDRIEVITVLASLFLSYLIMVYF